MVGPVERNGAWLESALHLAAVITCTVVIVTWVSAKVSEELNALDTATTVVAKKTDYKSNRSTSPTPPAQRTGAASK